MALKRTTEEVAAYFKEQGCELLGEYTGAMNKIKYRCSCGNISEISWNNFTKGKRCGCGSKIRNRYSIDTIREILSKEGFTLISESRDSHNQPIEYLCKCGKLISKPWREILHSGKYCLKCCNAKGDKHHAYTSYEKVQTFFVKQGCELLIPSWEDTTQVVSNIKLKYRCTCGREAESTWKNFLQGKRCGYCHPRGRVKKFTYDEVQQIFRDAGCELLETEYVNSGTKMKFRCSCGLEDGIRLNNFQRGERCHQCAVAKRIGPKHWYWRTDRDKMRVEKLFRSKCHNVLDRTLKVTNQKKTSKTAILLGYHASELQARIYNHPDFPILKGLDWHIDHIFPITAFMEHGITDLSVINCLENLRPMLGSENMSKHAKYDINDFRFWLETKGVRVG